MFQLIVSILCPLLAPFSVNYKKNYPKEITPKKEEYKQVEDPVPQNKDKKQNLLTYQNKLEVFLKAPFVKYIYENVSIFIYFQINTLIQPKYFRRFFIFSS